MAEGASSYREAISTMVVESSWKAIVDSGCSDHMFTSVNDICRLRPSDKVIKLADGKLIRAVLVETKKLHDPINNRTLVLRNALVVPAL
jgi:hypothetical protein